MNAAQSFAERSRKCIHQGGGGVQAGSSSVGTRVKRQINDVNVLI